MSRYVIAKHRPHNCGDDRCENHGKVFPSPNGPLVNVLDLPDAEHIHLHRRPDGTFDVVPMRLSAAAREAWGAEMWADAPEQGDERPRMMAGLWPKPEGEATHCLADDPDPTEQGDDR